MKRKAAVSWKAAYEAELDEKAVGDATPDSASGSITLDFMGPWGTGARATKTLDYKFKPTDTIATVRQVLKDKLYPELGPSQSIYRKGKVLQAHRTLKSHGMTSGNNYVITVITKVEGGAAMASEAPTYSAPHMFKPTAFPKLRTTTAADSLMCIDDRRDPRVVAPCGKHAFTGETYYQLMKRMLRKDAYSVQLRCPMPHCHVKIPFEFVQKAAMLTTEEKRFFAMHLELRAMASTTRVCPGCERMCERPSRLDYVRVSCGGRGCADFCFQCGGVWKGGGFQVCGNALCATYEIQQMIAEAEEITLTGGHKCPKLRACPKCIAIIEWKSACKHFTCHGCGFKFCFLCLKKAKRESDSDSADVCTVPLSSSFCTLAPRQVIK